MTTTERAYPVIPTEDNQKLFTTGLWIDVTKVLRDHGYPEPTGLDLVELQMSLFKFLYAEEEK